MKNLSLVTMGDQLRRSGQGSPTAIIVDSVLSKVLTPKVSDQPKTRYPDVESH